MERIWNELYRAAKSKLKGKEISPFIEYGNSSCAILGGNDKIYTGINVKSSTSINSSAEKNAIVAMLNDGEHVLKKMVLLNELEEVIEPSDEYYGYLLELSNGIDDIEVLVNYEKKEIKKMVDLLPDWWGTYRVKKN
ncbi:MAG TPA: hypothetical protein DCE23_02425 [Firmicutes bacterium]|nr:hypothetical protein [Bacillota bacterium]